MECDLSKFRINNWTRQAQRTRGMLGWNTKKSLTCKEERNGGIKLKASGQIVMEFLSVTHWIR